MPARYHKKTKVEVQNRSRELRFHHFFVAGLVLAAFLVLRAGSVHNLTSLAAGFGNLQVLLESSVGRQEDFFQKGIQYTNQTTGTAGSIALLPVQGGAGAEVNLAEGVYQLVFPALYGYVTPQGNRQVVVRNGQTATLTATYHRIAEVKSVARSGTEILEFTPSSKVALPQWGYVKGVAGVAMAGTNLWQYAEANMLYTQAQPPVVPTPTKTNNTTILTPGTSTTYDISLFTTGGVSSTYTAQVVDTLVVTNNQLAAVTVGPIRLVEQVCAGPGNTNCTLSPRRDLTGQEARAGNTMTLTIDIPNLQRNVQYYVQVTLNLDASIAAGTSLANSACIAAGGIQQCTTSPDIDLVFTAFVRESAGGTIFARERLTLTNPNTDKSNVLYTIGSSGDINAQSRSDGWEVQGYTLRSDAMLGIDALGDCSSAQLGDRQRSGYCLMKKNIDRMVAAVSGQSNTQYQLASESSRIPAGRLNPNNVAEGQVWHARPVGGIWRIGATELTGKGTIIVDGDLYIDGNITYKNPQDDIVGFVVRNGNVVIADTVTDVSGIFYIYSDTAAGKGKFITGTPQQSPGQSQPLIVRGLVVASGTKNGAQRDGAFELNRTYIGDLARIRSGEIAPNLNNIPPAEDFRYDARILVNPPPGFSRDVLRGRQ